MGKSIGFDNKEGFWKSEYSYSTSCFGSSNKRFVSFREVIGNEDSICYLHDENSLPNQFYGTQQTSIISVSFNDNVSSNKIYKSLSIEGGGLVEDLTLVNLFRANSDSDTQKETSLTAGTIKESGGIFYGHIGGIGRDTEANINAIGVYEDHYDSEGGSIIKTIESNYSNIVSNSRLFFLNSSGQVLVYNGSTLADWDQPVTWGSLSDDNNNAFEVFYEANEPYVLKNGIKTNLPAAAIESYFILNPNETLILCSITNSSINGEFPKGQHAEAAFVIPASNFEIYAFNLNYEPTDLDHSK